MKNIDNRYRLSKQEEIQLLKTRKEQSEKTPNNTLVISDIHIPFEHKDALEHCKKAYKDYNCNKVIFTGDIIDNHYSSFHNSDPNGMGAEKELQFSIDRLKKWYEAFPEAVVIMGNHDRIILRKAFASGIAKEWIKSFNEVLEVPNWEFVEEYHLHGVKYVHGEGGGSTLQTILQTQGKIVWGHQHSKFEIMYTANGLWGMCVACMIDKKAYAFAYAKAQIKTQLLGCGVVLNNGQFPILIPLVEK